jgi:hypothetical protein
MKNEETFRPTRETNLALLEEMRARLSRLRANRFQCRVSVIEAKRIKESLVQPFAALLPEGDKQ